MSYDIKDMIKQFKLVYQARLEELTRGMGDDIVLDLEIGWCSIRFGYVS